MLSFTYAADKLIAIDADGPRRSADTIDRNDFRTLEDAERVAADATEFAGKTYLAIDSGRHVSPRFDVIRAFTIGEPVSGSFNGDSYPEGEIVAISPTMKKITTSTGAEFYRRRNSGTWLRGKTFALGRGHVDRRNPSF